VKTPLPPARHVAVAAALWLLVPCALAATSSLVVLSLVVIAPLIAATAADERRTAIVAAATVSLTLADGFWHGQTEGANSWMPLTAACAVSVPTVVLAGVRRRREDHLARMTAIARTAQVALLPPLPPEVTGISIAARYRSATPDASVGGDLYEIIPTGHGIRMIIGDVRGHGLDAVLVARHVLSAFRRSAVAAPALEHVAGEVSRAIRPHLGEEDFVTAVLAQIAPSGELTVVNCGHHPPLLHHGGGLRPLTGTAALPLGLEDDFTTFTARWLPGDRLLLYTDGLVESRNQHGDFLPEDQIATALLAADCDQALDALMTAVHRNTGRHGHDDVALLLLEHGAYPHTSAKEQPRPDRCEDARARARFGGGPATEPERTLGRFGRFRMFARPR
jgi:phosphoserine phosphatase RsbU/P